MKYPIYRPDAVCPKCGFPTPQMLRAFCRGEHNVLIDKEVKRCTIPDEHLHLECCCGYELIFRPVDWDIRHGNNKEVAKKKKEKSNE